MQDSINKYTKVITDHLKEYAQLGVIDEYYIHRGAFLMAAIEDLEVSLKEGATQKSPKSDYTQVKGELSAHKQYMSELKIVGEKIGLSLADRQKLKWEKIKKETPGKGLIK
jgi:hypothetical protein